MPKGILYVETHPSSPDRLDEYHRWYEDRHLPEIVALPGVVSARRFEPAEPDGPFVVVYELDADDLDTVLPTVYDAVATGKVQLSDVVQQDPPPVMRLHRLMSSYGPVD